MPGLFCLPDGGFLILDLAGRRSAAVPRLDVEQGRQVTAAVLVSSALLGKAKVPLYTSKQASFVGRKDGPGAQEWT